MRSRTWSTASPEQTRTRDERDRMSGSSRRRARPWFRWGIDEVGATAVEYGLLLALLAGVIIGTVRVLGGVIAGIFDATVGTF